MRFLVCVSLVAALSSGCSFHYSLGGGPTYLGSGTKLVDTREIRDFERIEVFGSSDVRVRVGEATRVVVSGDDNIIDHVLTEVDGSTLEVRMENGSYRMKKPLVVTVYTPSLEALTIRGSGDAFLSGLDENELRLSVMGSGDVEAEGSVERLVARVKGSGDMSLRDLRARHADVSVMGSGDISLYASDSLDASVKGSGDISYWGNPTERSISEMGSGDIEAR